MSLISLNFPTQRYPVRDHLFIVNSGTEHRYQPLDHCENLKSHIRSFLGLFNYKRSGLSMPQKGTWLKFTFLGTKTANTHLSKLNSLYITWQVSPMCCLFRYCRNVASECSHCSLNSKDLSTWYKHRWHINAGRPSPAYICIKINKSIIKSVLFKLLQRIRQL